ncbi:hypothetical protein ABB30_15225 [Stenotrophomonas ginsengisoli]|uniref:Uncharacterized protein n=1 Tax=Stenotrophomonas ginsengisoli TaxID=336566 RepID=A0A0R0D5X9_9GAMM|nr:hypothetical protein ABB30_15225 [Stenotrophomonas ginsengisoli]
MPSIQIGLNIRNRLRDFPNTFEPRNDLGIVMIAVIIKIVLRMIGRRHLRPEDTNNPVQGGIAIDTTCQIFSSYPLVSRRISARHSYIRSARRKNFSANERIFQRRRTFITKLPMDVSGARAIFLRLFELVMTQLMRKRTNNPLAIPHSV